MDTLEIKNMSNHPINVDESIVDIDESKKCNGKISGLNPDDLIVCVPEHIYNNYINHNEFDDLLLVPQFIK